MRTVADFGVVDHVASAPANVLRELIQLSFEAKGLISLAGGLPADELFDVDGIEQATRTVMGSNTRTPWQYNATDGLPALRERLAELTRSRGIAVDAGRILVTSGSQQAIDVITRCLVAPGDGVIVERPTFITALQTFRMARARLTSVGHDAHGPRLDEIEAALESARDEGRRIKLIYLVPSFSNPAGRVIGGERRAELVALAVRHGVTILEDDPYGELWFDRPPPAAMRAIAGEAADSVIYTSSLSKILSPGLRIGWMVAPKAIEQPLRLVKSTADIHSSVFSQCVAEAYLGLGRLPPRMELLRRSYARKAGALSAALADHLGPSFIFERPTGGMFIWGRLAENIDTPAFSRHAVKDAAVSVVPGEPFFADAPEPGWLRLSFTQGGLADLAEAARRMASAHASFAAPATLQDHPP